MRTLQFSSFDRTGGNDRDGFDGAYSCLRTIDTGCVIAEHRGPGEVGAIWFTRDGGDVSRTGTITIELDGIKVLDAPLQDVVDGKLGAPFTSPLVANADASSGGVLLEIPMPFRESMRITTQHNPHFYHVSYRVFADADGVTTFDPSDPAQDVVARLKAAGLQDPKPPLPGARTVTRNLALAPGHTQTLARTTAPGLLTALKISLPQLSGAATPTAAGSGGGGSSQFRLAIDPANHGVVLTRRPGLRPDRQADVVSVDGHPAGRWGPATPAGGMRTEQSIALPASLTKGKTHITVNSTSVSGGDHSDVSYQANCITGKGQVQRTDSAAIGSTASEQAHHYRVVAPAWQEQRALAAPLTKTGRTAFATTRELLTRLRLRIAFDGRRTVDSPLGEFFGSGQSLAAVRSLMFGVDPPSHTLQAWWPMPFASRATVQLYNGSATAVTAGSASISWAPSAAHAHAVRTGTEGYFHTMSHAGPTTPGESWSFLRAQGRGKFVGASHTMQGHTSRAYLEGDERVLTDGARTPQIHGTGTEDFYQSGWYFNRGPYTQPFNGNPAHLNASNGCATGRDCTDAYRLQIHDAVAFNRSIDYTIEHGRVNDEQADYSSTAYWYGSSSPGAHHSDTLHVGDPSSELAHHYTSSTPGPVTVLDSVFEGDYHNPPRLSASTRATQAPVTFTLAIDPHNNGVELRRTSDQQRAPQHAQVSVDGHPLHPWYQLLGNSSRRWLDDTYQLPPSLTRGRHSLTITLTPAQDAPAWSVAAYETHSLL
ncbi:glycoside hydrolase family 172 protein [Streptomyces sp. NPDC059070]|uniref:glycoside hydrolase family 172 protein n=1 Tax=Streptomyces sp. NPDC059070 TaxID=3346713 RepID=UPI00367393F9